MRLPTRVFALAVVGAVSFGLQFSPLSAQDRLAKMPGYDQFRKMQTALQGGAFVSGAISPSWADDSKAFTYTFGETQYRFDVTTMAAVSVGAAPAGGRGGRGGRAGGPPAGGGRGGRGAGAPGLGGCPAEQVERGRQATCYGSPDGKMRAMYKERNIWIANEDGSGEKALTTDGSEEKRIK
jgi:hypothetical protein